VCLFGDSFIIFSYLVIRPRLSVFSIGSAPLTRITKSDAQFCGGETRCGLKIHGVSPCWLPRDPPLSCFSVYGCQSAFMAAASRLFKKTKKKKKTKQKKTTPKKKNQKKKKKKTQTKQKKK
ncbi:hypothetical protein O8C69_25645, partial [Enterobacter hormaechei subsp. steigerwaltii]|nr:hypothetical protein [Enterobacter hormaechei subsp. steigerwaltii]